MRADAVGVCAVCISIVGVTVGDGFAVFVDFDVKGFAVFKVVFFVVVFVGFVIPGATALVMILRERR